MDHGLLPAEASLAFLVLLLLIYIRKQQYYTSTSNIYRRYIYITITYAVLQIIAITVLRYLTDGILFTIIWRLMYIFFFISIYFIFLYGFATIHKINNKKFIDVIKYNVDTKIISAIFILITLVLLLPIKINLVDYISQNNIIYMTTKTGLLIILLTTILSIYFTIRVYSKKEELTKAFKTSYIVALPLFIACLGGQTWYKGSTIPITVLMYIAYLIYYNIENPDILYLHEQKRIEEEFKNNTNQKVDLFDIVDYKLVESSESIVNMAKKIKKENLDTKEKIQLIKELHKDHKIFFDEIKQIFTESQIKEINENYEEYNIVDLIKLLKECVDENKKSKDIKLIINVSQSLSKKYYGDYEKISNSIKEVLHYCCKTTNLGRITIDILNQKNQGNDKLIFKIRDTSDGLKDKTEKEVIEEEIGLKVTNSYIDMLKGKFIFNSKYKVGNKFYIELEQQVVDYTNIGDITKYKEIDSTIINTKLDNKKALIVDDNKENLFLTKLLLNKYNIIADIVDTGNECIKKIKLEEEYDIIFMDIMMPEIDGVEVMHSLKELDGYNLPPIVALTGNALPGMKASYMKEGFDDYISKPIEKKELERVLIKFLQNKIEE